MLKSWAERGLAQFDSRGVRIWGPGYVRERLLRETPDPSKPIKLYVCVADHYEPNHKRPGIDEERRRVARWVRDYPAVARRHRDSQGRPHVRTLFFPIDEYRPEHLDALAELHRDGYADIEVHLHHENDTAENLRSTLEDFARTLFETHGMLRRDPVTGRIEYAFIHGNWALDNSHPDGSFCGVHDELTVLAQTGCYVDMTLPSAPSPTQTRTVNSIYYATGHAGRAKSHDEGIEVCVGGGVPTASEHPLMMIQGPLAPNFASRKFGVLPRLEAGELSPDNTVEPRSRVQLWVEHGVTVRGAPNHRFIKLHAHGTQPGGEEYFLEAGGGYDRLLSVLEDEYNDGKRYELHYVSAREMYETVKGLEARTIAP